MMKRMQLEVEESVVGRDGGCKGGKMKSGAVLHKKWNN
jgi:hypothetical protein